MSDARGVKSAAPSMAGFHTRVIFEAAGDGTLPRLEMEFPSKSELERVDREHGAVECGKAHVNRRGEYLESLKEKV